MVHHLPATQAPGVASEIMWIIRAGTSDDDDVDSSRNPLAIVLSKLEEQTDPLESEDTRPICIGLGKWRVVITKTQEVEFRDGTETEGVE